MANQDLHNTYIERDRLVPRDGSGAGGFIIAGAVLVAFLVLLWLFSMGTTDAPPAAVPVDNGAPVTLENQPEPAAPAATVPTDDSTVPAPAEEPSVAPAAPAEPAPAQPVPSGN